VYPEASVACRYRSEPRNHRASRFAAIRAAPGSGYVAQKCLLLESREAPKISKCARSVTCRYTPKAGRLRSDRLPVRWEPGLWMTTSGSASRRSVSRKSLATAKGRWVDGIYGESFCVCLIGQSFELFDVASSPTNSNTKCRKTTRE